jgi:hypothetical protein
MADIFVNNNSMHLSIFFNLTNLCFFSTIEKFELFILNFTVGSKL